MVRVIIIDQASLGDASPYALQQRERAGNPMTWTELRQRVAIGLHDSSCSWLAPREDEVGDDYRPALGETLFRERLDGTVGVWKRRSG